MANGDAAGYVAYRARKSWDLVIAGRGPVGLAVAIVAAAQGIYVLVLERRDFPLDKACGEGLLPLGVRALERLGVTPVLDRADVRGFTGIRFIQEDGSATESPFPDHSGLGSRRTALVEAATRRADVLGAVIRHRPAVSGFESIASGPIIRTASGPVSSRLPVAADGLHSPLRRAAGLDAAPNCRLGMRDPLCRRRHEENFAAKFREHPSENRFAFSSVRFPIVNLKFRCRENADVPVR